MSTSYGSFQKRVCVFFHEIKWHVVVPLELISNKEFQNIAVDEVTSRVEQMIAEDCNQGELCVLYNDSAYYGWWAIDFEAAKGISNTSTTKEIEMNVDWLVATLGEGSILDTNLKSLLNELEGLREDKTRFHSIIDMYKVEAGFDTNVSFDVVMQELLHFYSIYKDEQSLLLSK